MKNGFLNNFEKTTAISLKQINIIIVIKRKLVFFFRTVSYSWFRVTFIFSGLVFLEITFLYSCFLPKFGL